MLEFDESRAEFRGFTAHYRDKILPRLIELDLGRVAIMRKYVMWMIAGAVIGLIAFFITMQFGLFGIGAFIGFAIFTAGMGVAEKAKKPLYLDAKNALVGGTAGFVGWDFTPEGFIPLPVERFQKLGLLPKEHKRAFEDEISGLAHGAKFVLHEAHLRRKNDKNYVTVFRGVMIALDFPVKFSGTTLIVRDSLFKFGKKKGLKRVGLVDPVFEKAFDAFGSDQVEARYLLTPTFMQRLVDLETLLKGKKIRAAFQEGQLLICVETGNQFEPGSLFKSLTETDRTDKLIKEFGLIFDIVDGVLKPEANRVNYRSNSPITGT